jgi:sialate O-acetylesterase
MNSRAILMKLIERNKNRIDTKTMKIRLSSFLLILLIAQVGFSQVRLPRLISDGMILQRETPVKIWGWAKAGEKVSLQLNKQSFQAIADKKGNWQIILPQQQTGGPFDMSIQASNQITLKNILFGDVWLCSGQSNMEYPMSRLKDRYSKEIANCENSSIRQFKIPMKYDFNAPPEDYSGGKWEEANSQTILNFSGVAYFFARDLYEKYHVPIGILNAAVGGTPAEAWMSADALKDFPQYIAEAEKCKDQSYINKILDEERVIYSAWYGKLNQNDKGLSSQPNWKVPSMNSSDWATMVIPGYWADEGMNNVNGAMWFRKEIDLPSSMIGKSAWIQMGRIVDADSVFINSQFIGTTSYQYPQRKYTIPANVLKAGKNVIVVRLISSSGKCGFIKDKPYKLFTPGDTIQLAGEWKCKLGTTMEPLQGQTFFQYKPTGLYNGMLAPSTNYAIKGAVWYQGESNADRYNEYQKLLTSLITDWRQKRAQGNFPFIIVQLPNYMDAKDEPSESNWAEFRYAQLKTLSVENTALVVTIDLGDWNDIHPQNKLDVGKRVALAAEQRAYGDTKVVASGPIFQSMKTTGNKIELTFSNTGSGLTVKGGGELKQFSIAGADKKYSWANAKIEGNRIIVWNDAVVHPFYIRYAWADNPEGANLYNKDGLPASPFTTE